MVAGIGIGTGIQTLTLTVAKFGGTSVGTAEAIIRSTKIVLNNPQIKVVIVSATSGTTNALAELFDLLVNFQTNPKNPQSKILKLIQEIKEKHLKIIESIGIKETNAIKIIEEFEQKYSQTLPSIQTLTPTLTLKDRDFLLSFGERISAAIFTSTLQKLTKEQEHVQVQKQEKKVKHLSATKIVRTDENFGEANPDMLAIQELTKENLLPLLELNTTESTTVIVTEGFIASTSSGEITTLGRGGSDYSSALIIRGLYQHDPRFNLLEIWTDVDGISTTDPKLVKDARNIRELHLNEAAELAFFGAKVLHPLTLIPLADVDINVYVGNSFKEQNQKGTFIRKNIDPTPLVRALALRNSQTIITLSRVKKPTNYGFLAHVFSILTKYKISVDNVTTSEISTSFTFYDNPNITSDLIEELSKYANVKVEGNLSLVSLIGHKIVKIPDILSSVFKVMEGYHIRAVFMGASKNNISFLIAEEHGVEVINKLHASFLV
ncbi:MAG: aspartate kinase [Oligoflexia bacterium]|nr:aspartate kinase [Oligoflexia bacterium]